MDYVGFNCKVLVYEFRGVGIVGVNSTDPGGGKENVSWFFRGKKIRDLFLTCKVQLSVSPQDKVCIAFAPEPSHYGRSYKPCMTGDIYFNCFIHIETFLKCFSIIIMKQDWLNCHK